jgi:hypothetical protein
MMDVSGCLCIVISLCKQYYVRIILSKLPCGAYGLSLTPWTLTLIWTVYDNSVHNMQITEYVFIIKTSPLIHFEKTMGVYRKKHAENIGIFCDKILFFRVQARSTCSNKSSLNM